MGKIGLELEPGVHGQDEGLEGPVTPRPRAKPYDRGRVIGKMGWEFEPGVRGGWREAGRPGHRPSPVSYWARL
jgi:hypothetical protein